MGTEGRTAQAWEWALTGTCNSPVTLSPAPGHAPSRSQIIAEVTAHTAGSTAPFDVPTDYFDQLSESRRVLAWLAGSSDEIPVDDDNRGRLIGARDDYARTDHDMRQVREHILAALDACLAPEKVKPPTTSDLKNPPTWSGTWWLHGVCDSLDWILGERPAAPLCHRNVGLPSVSDLLYEESAADQVARQDPLGSIGAHGADCPPPPSYAEAVRATICWVRGETTTPPIDRDGLGAYRRRS
jgi:hypothetical protein